MDASILLAIACFAGAIWLSNKTYPTDNEKRVGWFIAVVLFFVVAPLLLYFGAS
jgi:hypothetical protein